MTLKIPSDSVEYIRVPFELVRAGEVVNVSGYDVSLAYTAGKETLPTVWVAGDWELVDSVWYARALTGPGAPFAPGVGTWALWVKVDASPETPVRFSGTVVIHP